jgi:DNA invertase Pin-like site-specific DNA recombinase
MKTSPTKPVNVGLYVRTSTAQQIVENQLLELREYVAARRWTAAEYSDQISGTTERRPGLDAMMKDARRRKFSTVLVWSLDRVGRSLPHLVTLIAELESLGIAFVSLKEGLDLTTAAGKLQLHILAALASFERERLRERTIAGLQRARNAGKRLGRPRVHPVVVNGPKGTVRQLAAEWGVSKSTAARWLAVGKVPERDNRLPAAE